MRLPTLSQFCRSFQAPIRRFRYERSRWNERRSHLRAINLLSATCVSELKMADQPYSFLDQENAKQVDIELMGELGFTVEQLMELAGQSVAIAVARQYAPIADKRVLVVAGPGNNGGDGLVAARHLHHFGALPSIWYPKRPEKQLFKALVKQCEVLSIPFVPQATSLDISSNRYDLVLDAIFGFSFDPSRGFRAPFDSVMESLRKCTVPIASVDIPTGWDVEKGDSEGVGLNADTLTPKRCAMMFKGNHWLGGRFVPPVIKEKYQLRLPAYEGTEYVVSLPPLKESSAM